GHAQGLARLRHQARRERTAPNLPARYQVLRGAGPAPRSQAGLLVARSAIQTFLWSDYHASPDTSYDFTIIALYGDIHAFEERHTLAFSIKTEPDFDQGHGVFFNRGTIASHAFETTFNNKPLTEEMTENVSDDGKLLDPETAWLSRGLAEACLKYINDMKQGEGLRVCAYEFTYLPVLRALKRAIDRGVDVQIVYHDTKKDNDPNRAAIVKAALPKSVTHVRTRTQIPHNKFIVKLVGGTPVQVWSGSTNFTDTGFFGQTNVGHQVADAKLAKSYLDYWTELAQDAVHSKALTVISNKMRVVVESEWPEVSGTSTASLHGIQHPTLADVARSGSLRKV